MTTLASPTQGGAIQPVWRVDMAPTASGPTHAIDAQQVWTVLDGGATVEIDGAVVAISAGDTLIIPADCPSSDHGPRRRPVRDRRGAGRDAGVRPER